MSDNTPNFLKKLSIPRPSSGHSAALGEADRPIAVFSDFDGTVFLQDTGHVSFDKFGSGKERREEVDQSIGKTRTFRDASEESWGSLHVTLERAKEESKERLTIDPDFIAFFDYSQSKGVEFTVISAGVKPSLRTALDTFVGPERSAKINIISNDAVISPDGHWTAKWSHDSPLGIDKSSAIRDWLAEHSDGKRPVPKVVFVGDGVSDLAAAKQADISFARQGLALEAYCIEHMIPYIPYMRFKDVLHDIKYLIKGNRYHDKEAAENFKRAQIQQLTGGLGPLSAPTKPKFGLASDDEDSDSEDNVSVHSKHSPVSPTAESKVPEIPRPHTPPGEPSYLARPALTRQYSTGDD